MTEYIQVETTVGRKSDAEKMAKVLAQKKLSACTQITGPIKSVYHWKGKLQNAKEFLLLIKTKKTLYLKIEREIKNIHPYESPEIIAVPIVAGSTEYLNWLNKEI